MAAARAKAAAEANSPLSKALSKKFKLEAKANSPLKTYLKNALAKKAKLEAEFAALELEIQGLGLSSLTRLRERQQPREKQQPGERAQGLRSNVSTDVRTF